GNRGYQASCRGRLAPAATLGFASASRSVSPPSGDGTVRYDLRRRSSPLRNPRTPPAPSCRSAPRSALAAIPPGTPLAPGADIPLAAAALERARCAAAGSTSGSAARLAVRAAVIAAALCVDIRSISSGESTSYGGRP